MTISTESTRVEFTGDGATLPFAVPFKFLVKTDLVVVLRTILTGVDVVQSIYTHYTVLGAGDANGTVTFVTAPPSTQRVVIYNDPPLTQLVDYLAGDTFPAETHETALDRLTIQQKRTREIATRTPSLGNSDTDGSGAYDAKSNRIKSLGTPTATTDATTKTYVDVLVNNTALGPAPTGLIATGSVTSRLLADRWGEIKNVKDFGAVGDATAGSMATGTDDSSAIQAALTAASISGGTVLFPPGAYRVNSAMTAIATSGVHIEGNSATINWTSTVSSASLFRFEKVSAASGTLSGPMTRGDNVIATALTIPVGSIVSILNGDYFYRDALRNNKMGELLIPEEAQPAYLAVPAIFSYASGHAISVITPNVKSSVSGLRIIGSGTDNGTVAVKASGCVDFSVSGCSIEHVNAGVQFWETVRTTVSNNFFYSIDKTASGYSVSVSQNNYGALISNNVADKVRHFVTTVGESGVSRATLISGNNVSRSKYAAIDTHAQGYDTTISGNHISDSLIGIQVRSPRTTVTGNVLHNCHMYPYPQGYSGVASKSSQHCIYALELGYVNLIIKGNVITMDDAIATDITDAAGTTTLYGGGIQVHGGTNTVTAVFTPEYIRVIGNSIGKTGSIGGCIILVPVGSTEVQVSGNVLERSPYHSLSVESSGTVNGSVVVSSNSLDGSDRAAAGNYGIRVKNATTALVTGNTNRHTDLDKILLLDTVTTATVENNSGMRGFEPVLTSVTTYIGDQGTVTFTASDATPTVATGRTFITAGALAITDFDDGVDGQIITVRAHGAITLTDSANLQLQGDTDFVMALDDTVTLANIGGTNWYETGRRPATTAAEIPLFPVVTFTDLDATPTVANGKYFLTTGTTAITDFDDGVVGQTITVKAKSTITITDAGDLELVGNFAMTTGDTITLTMIETGKWSEISRSNIA